MQYDFKGYWALVKQLQPKAVCFSDAGPGVRWVGNESGNAGETCWSTIITQGMAPGVADSKYLNTGDEKGTEWIPAETDVSIRPGWFYHPSEDDKVRSPKNLVNLYYQSTGRNSLLLLNVPPNREGLLCPQDVAAIKEYRSILNETFKTNLAKSGKIKSLVDNKLSTWENIAEGQRIAEAKLEYWNGQEWQLIKQFTTVGYKRLLRFEPVTTAKLRLTVLRALAPAQIAEVGVYKGSARE
jgi:alpha-L-fucosidase